jgi:cytochrome c peroxidase
VRFARRIAHLPGHLATLVLSDRQVGRDIGRGRRTFTWLRMPTVDQSGLRRNACGTPVRQVHGRQAEMAAPMAIAVFVMLSLMSAFAGAPRNDYRLEADNPVRPLPAPPLGINPLDDAPNPPEPERVRLGRWLFYDTRLSADGTVSCATCHVLNGRSPTADGWRGGVGGHGGIRKTPSFINVAQAFVRNRFGWDGHAASLEEQSLRPIVNPSEMGSTASRMVATLSRIAGYAPYFERAFGDARVTPQRVASALADYQRTRMSGNSAWDRWQSGDARALSPAARRGWELFTGDARCSRCHFGPNLTDRAFHSLGIGWDATSKRYTDEGRGAITGRPADRGAFKTPTLRDVARHPPYMHDGSLPTLRDVVLFYKRGGVKNPHLDTQIRPLRLSSTDVDALVAFLEALNGEGFIDRVPSAFPK